ncbi:hypothetical protein MMC26_006430 [Xylographa opegraphella]|nr:hypothetical protein [Xylographa opegraphella]
MHFTPAIALTILAFAATTTTAYSYGHDSLLARSPYEFDSLYKRDAYADPTAYADADADADPYPLPKFSFHHHTKPSSKPDAHPDPPTSPGSKPPSSSALKKALAFIKKLQSGTLKIASSDAGKLLGVACDVNTIAGIFDSSSTVGSDVTNGITVACTAGQIVQVAAGAKRKRWENYKRAAAAEAEARAEADAYEEHEMMLAARWAEGLEE